MAAGWARFGRAARLRAVAAEEALDRGQADGAFTTRAVTYRLTRAADDTGAGAPDHALVGHISVDVRAQEPGSTRIAGGAVVDAQTRTRLVVDEPAMAARR